MTAASTSTALRRPVLLVIMDGIGLNPSRLHNAVAAARTPALDHLYANHKVAVIEASGRAVGLPAGQMGNSEVGHLTLGCGSLLRQDLVRINDACDDGSLGTNQALLSALAAAREADRPLHLLGLVSDGGIHSHIDHLMALLDAARAAGVRPLVHMITDGRDTAPRCAERFVTQLEPALDAAGGAIASLCGRYFAMDRDQRWDRVERAWRLLVHGDGSQAADAAAGIEQARAAGQGDEFLEPIRTDHFDAIQAGDQVVFFNFRNDRPRELTEALAVADFDGFARGEAGLAAVTTLTRYDPNYDLPVMFEKERPAHTLGETVSRAGLKQFRCAETEKYPHVTFFFNGQREDPLPGEQRALVDSPRVATYDLQPEMSAHAVRDATLEALQAGDCALYVVNFANGDMVGHTGVPEACVAAVEVVDQCVGELVTAATAAGVSVIVTADHGNCDMMCDPITGEPHTQHTTFPVACCVVDPANPTLVNGGGLANIAPTVLSLMGLQHTVDRLQAHETQDRRCDVRKAAAIDKRRVGWVDDTTRDR
ncbi:MAG: 2,3-bisphosphoglycerate-independent phosphoglycerate mutase, partial [Pseudomonadota bacterium]